MIDRELRYSVAVQIKTFLAGQMTNCECEDCTESILKPQRHRSDHDRAAEAVTDAVYFLYDDLHEHCLVGKYEVQRGSELAAKVERWLLFLRSDYEYGWPYSEFSSDPLRWCPWTILTFGFWTRRARRKRRIEMEAAGDMEFWPFLSKKDFEIARERFGRMSW